MYENYKKKDVDLPFIPVIFKEKLLNDIQSEFVELQKYMRQPDEIADYLIKVINVQTISSIDGANDILLDSLNRIYCTTGMKLVDKRRHFNTIVTKFEVFLKKLYYVIHKEEMKNGREENSMPTFIDCIFAFSCLKGLKYNTDTRYKKFYTYLELVKQWRNDESHTAPDASSKELNSAIHVVAAMYYYVVSQTITELEQAGL